MHEYRERQQDYFRELSHVAALSANQGIGQQLFLSANGPDHHSPSAWVPAELWPWDRARPDFRGVLQNELVFDFDVKVDGKKNYANARTRALRLRSYCERRAIPHYIWPSAGEGIHTSLFLDARGYQSEASWADIRSSVYAQVSRESGVSSDPLKIHFRDDALGSLVRMEGGVRWVRADLTNFDLATNGYVPSYKYWCQSPPVEPKRIIKPWHIVYPSALQLFRVPEKWLPPPTPLVRTAARPGHEPNVLVFRLVSAMRQGHRLSDYGRFAVAIHLVQSGWSLVDVQRCFERTPNYDAELTARKLAQISRDSGRLVAPSAFTMEKMLGDELRGLGFL